MKPIICDPDSASKYLKFLFDIKAKQANHSPVEQDAIWLDFYQSWTKDGYIYPSLPKLLALIHPDFYYKTGKPIIDSLDWKGNNRFRIGINQVDKCQAQRYMGVECVFNSMPEIRGKCEADHVWPNSLGGPSILENRLILCKFHNGMKSNDISHFDWTEVPSWLQIYLDKLYRLKL